MKRPRQAACAGFTLLELTVTLAILGVVLSIVYGVFSQTLAGKERAERAGENAAAARAALMTITRDLTSLRPMTGSTGTSSQPNATPSPGAATGPVPIQRGLFLGRVRSEGGIPLDDLAFTAILRRPTAVTFAATDLGIVHYFVAAAPDSRRRALYRETVFSLTGGAFDPDKPGAENAALLLPGVSEFDLRYFDGKDWVREWNSTDARNFAPAPLGVEVILTVTDDSDESETYETAIDLPMVRAAQTPRVGGEPRR